MKQTFHRISRLILGLIMLTTSMQPILAAPFGGLPDEDLSYAIMYKWGPINKQAGWAVLSLRGDSTQYRAMLSAGTMPWADKVYMVRDTLKSLMVKRDCVPLQYIKISHEDGNYAYNLLNYTRSGSDVTVDVKRAFNKKNRPVQHRDTVLHAHEPGVDMLSVFYYIRHLDFSAMKPDDKIEVNVFSGRRVELLTIHYGGRETIKIDNKKVDTYVITFSFTIKGKTSDAPMYCWMSTDGQRIPLKLEGQLPIGKVQAFYKGTARQQHD